MGFKTYLAVEKECLIARAGSLWQLVAVVPGRGRGFSGRAARLVGYAIREGRADGSPVAEERFASRREMLFAFAERYDAERRTIARCALCDLPVGQFLGCYPDCVCGDCDKRAVDRNGRAARHPTWKLGLETGDSPVFIDGRKCWRRYRLGCVTMLDRDDCGTWNECFDKHLARR